MKACNFRGVGFEIDIAATKGRTLACVEVKARSQLELDLDQLMNNKKYLALHRGLRNLSSQRDLTYSVVRIDLALVHRHQQGVNVYYFCDV